MEREEWNHRYAGAELLWTAAPNRILVGEVEELPAGRALEASTPLVQRRCAPAAR